MILFSSGFRCLSEFAFKCNVIQQRYGSGSRSTCSLEFKLTGIQIAIKSMPGTTNREHRKLVGVKMMSLFGYGIQFLLSGGLSVFQNLNYNLHKRLSDVLPNQQNHQVLYSDDALAPTAVPYPAFTTVLCSYRVGVLGETLRRDFLETTKVTAW